jgi:hypothetical protein
VLDECSPTTLAEAANETVGILHQSPLGSGGISFIFERLGEIRVPELMTAWQAWVIALGAMVADRVLDATGSTETLAPVSKTMQVAHLN